MTDPIIVVSEEISKTAGWAAVGVASLFVGWAKLRSFMSAEKRDSSSSNASGEVIDMLRVEVNRLADQNLRLASMVNDLQLQVSALRSENADLRVLIQKDNHGQQHRKAVN